MAKILEKESITLKDTKKSSIRNKIKESIEEAGRLQNCLRDPTKFDENPWLDQLRFSLTTDDYHPEAKAVVGVDPDTEGIPVLDVGRSSS